MYIYISTKEFPFFTVESLGSYLRCPPFFSEPAGKNSPALPAALWAAPGKHPASGRTRRALLRSRLQPCECSPVTPRRSPLHLLPHRTLNCNSHRLQLALTVGARFLCFCVFCFVFFFSPPSTDVLFYLIWHFLWLCSVCCTAVLLAIVQCISLQHM